MQTLDRKDAKPDANSRCPDRALNRSGRATVTRAYSCVDDEGLRRYWRNWSHSRRM